MKKLVSIFFTLSLAFVFAISANASEAPLRFFSAAPEDEYSAEYISSYANEKGFDGIVADLRKSVSSDFLRELSDVSGNLLLYVLGGENFADKIPTEAVIIAESGISEEAFSALAEKRGAENLAFFLPFNEESALSEAVYFYENGFYKTLFIENLYSS